MSLKTKKAELKPVAAQQHRRRWTRFHPDVMTEGSVDIRAKKGKYSPTHRALVLDEAFKGCGLVVVGPFPLTVGDTLWVKVGQMDPMEAEIRWMEKLEDRIFKLGIFFLE